MKGNVEGSVTREDDKVSFTIKESTPQPRIAQIVVYDNDDNTGQVVYTVNSRNGCFALVSTSE